MNSYQVLEQETNAAIEANDETKLLDVLRRIKNLTVSPTCKDYPWKNLIDKIVPLLKGIDREKTIEGINKLRQREADKEMISVISKAAALGESDLEDISDDFLRSYAHANTKGKKKRHD